MTTNADFELDNMIDLLQSYIDDFKSNRSKYSFIGIVGIQNTDDHDDTKGPYIFNIGIGDTEKHMSAFSKGVDSFAHHTNKSNLMRPKHHRPCNPKTIELVKNMTIDQIANQISENPSSDILFRIVTIFDELIYDNNTRYRVVVSTIPENLKQILPLWIGIFLREIDCMEDNTFTREDFIRYTDKIFSNDTVPPNWWVFFKYLLKYKIITFCFK